MIHLPQNLRALLNQEIKVIQSKYRHSKLDQEFVEINGTYFAEWLYQTLVQMPEGFKPITMQKGGHGWGHHMAPGTEGKFPYMKTGETIQVIELSALAQLRIELTTKDQRIKELEKQVQEFFFANNEFAIIVCEAQERIKELEEALQKSRSLISPNPLDISGQALNKEKK